MKSRSTPIAATIFAILVLAGCNREPRSTAFFEANPDEARTVLASCTAGTQTDPECANARDGLDDFTRKRSINNLIDQAKAHGG